MQGLRNAQRQYDRLLPDEGQQRAEREFEHPEFAPANAIRCGSVSEALDLSKKMPSRVVIVATSKFVEIQPATETPANGEQKTSG